MPRLQDGAGKPIQLPSDVEDLIKTLIHPTPKRQIVAIRNVLAKAGYEFDQTTMEAFALACDMAAFGNFLAKEDNPKTGMPFIKKEPKRHKQKAFKSLLLASESKQNASEGNEEHESQALGKKSGAVNTKGKSNEDAND